MLRILLALTAILPCLGRAAAAPPDTLSDTLRVVDAVSVVRYYEEGTTRYYLNEYTFGYGNWYNIYPHVDGHEHATFVFDLSPVPDTALVTAAEFGFHQYSDDTAGTPPYNVCAYDYSGADAESLFNAVESAAAISLDYEAHQGWNRVPLTEAGVAALRARLAGNTARLAVAEHAWGELGYAHGDTAPGSLRPYLLVSYLPTAVEERSKLDAPRLTLEITPNPATGFAEVTLPGPRPGKTVLKLCDVSGRVAMERVCRGGSVRLDCSSLAPGAYVVRVEAGGVRSLAVLRVLGR